MKFNHKRICPGAFFVLLCCLLQSMVACAQNGDSTRPHGLFKEHLRLNGYLKNVQSVTFAPEVAPTGLHFLHNRINIHWEGQKISLHAGMRNRLFYGEGVKTNPLLVPLLEQDYNAIDLSKVVTHGEGWALHTTLDRLFMEWRAARWDLRLGRQRINWGKHWLWNPHDLFNTYNFIDFDYEERPGSDALYFRYYPTTMSSLHLALKEAWNDSSRVVAIMYSFNHAGYDWQLLAGEFMQGWTAGIGWAGALFPQRWGIGFKGEVSFFSQESTWVASWGLDYMFSGGTYLQSGGIYNNNGRLNSLADLQNTFRRIDARTPFPARQAYYVQLTHPITPLLQGNSSWLYSPDIRLLFWIPSLSYSIQENWEILLLAQVYFAETSKSFKNQGNVIFARLKWSF